MAFAEGNGARIYWRSVGSGEPLLLVMGFGYPASMWHHVEPRLAERLRVVLFDHRGIGRSGMAPGPHEMSTLAADAAAVLDAAGVARAHVFGVSMGGWLCFRAAAFEPLRRADHHVGRFVPTARALQDFDLREIKRVQQRLRTVQAAEPCLRGLVDDPVVFQRAFPAHPANHANGFQMRLPMTTAPGMLKP